MCYDIGMAYITRDAEQAVVEGMKTYPAVTVYGPRQAGKTTMVRHLFPEFTYVNLDEATPRLLARRDPDEFFVRYPEPVILDEIQNAPELVPVIQARADRRGLKGQYVLTGSRQLQLKKAVDESLVGRTDIVWVFPLSLSEIQRAGFSLDRDESILMGGFPVFFQEQHDPYAYFQNYLALYLEHDVALEGIRDLDRFSLFLQLLAGRTGQVINYSDLSDTVGVSSVTVKSWVALLSRLHVVFVLRPFASNREKRLVKSPKIYFCDTGLVCGLLGIKTPDMVRNDRILGSLFETLVVGEAFKNAYRYRMEHSLSFYRNTMGKEVDIVLEDGGTLIPFEIKSGQALREDAGKNMAYFAEKYPDCSQVRTVIYAGEDVPAFMGVRYVNFKRCGSLFKPSSQPFVFDPARHVQG